MRLDPLLRILLPRFKGNLATEAAVVPMPIILLNLTKKIRDVRNYLQRRSLKSMQANRDF
jgi:hypothetical protein